MRLLRWLLWPVYWFLVALAWVVLKLTARHARPEDSWATDSQPTGQGNAE